MTRIENHIMNLPKRIDSYIENHFPYLKYLLCRTAGRCYFGKYLASAQGLKIRHHYMTQLVQRYSGCSQERIVLIEIGSWAGGSAITWASAIQKYSDAKGSVICVDPWIDYIDCDADKDPILKTMKEALIANKIYKLFLHNVISSGFSEMISILRGASEDVLPAISEGSADIIYIDGDHSYDHVMKDITRSFHLLKDGGILCGDDLELQYRDVDQTTIHSCNHLDYITDPGTKIKYHPGVSLAVHDYFKTEVSAWDGFWAMQKNTHGFSKISLSEGDEIIHIPKHLQ
ncbi:MAG: class I SAM-dependent methyltransferase [Deltaproteobacteria bacterium]